MSFCLEIPLTFLHLSKTTPFLQTTCKCGHNKLLHYLNILSYVLFSPKTSTAELTCYNTLLSDILKSKEISFALLDLVFMFILNNKKVLFEYNTPIIFSNNEKHILIISPLVIWAKQRNLI